MQKVYGKMSMLFFIKKSRAMLPVVIRLGAPLGAFYGTTALKRVSLEAHKIQLIRHDMSSFYGDIRGGNFMKGFKN